MPTSHKRSTSDSRAGSALRRADARVRALFAFARPRLAETWVWFPAFVFVVLLLTWASLIDVLKTEREAVTFAAVKSSRVLADTYQAQVVRSLVSIDQTLKTVAYAYVVSGNAVLTDLQNRDMLPSAIVFQMSITNNQGDVIASTRATHPRNVADESYFAAQRHGDRLFISRTRTDPETHAPELIFSRRLSNARGEFAGVVTLGVDPSYFTSSYDSLRMGKHGFLALLGTDGTMRVQQTSE
ncbi:MAG: PDC sensor domain-containing protein, partial [Trinickia sp.]